MKLKPAKKNHGPRGTRAPAAPYRHTHTPPYPSQSARPIDQKSKAKISYKSGCQEQNHAKSRRSESASLLLWPLPRKPAGLPRRSALPDGVLPERWYRRVQVSLMACRSSSACRAAISSRSFLVPRISRSLRRLRLTAVSRVSRSGSSSGCVASPTSSRAACHLRVSFSLLPRSSTFCS